MTKSAMKVWIYVIVCYDHAKMMDDYGIMRGPFRAHIWHRCQVDGCKDQAILGAQVLVNLK